MLGEPREVLHSTPAAWLKLAAVCAAVHSVCSSSPANGLLSSEPQQLWPKTHVASHCHEVCQSLGHLPQAVPKHNHSASNPTVSWARTVISRTFCLWPLLGRTTPYFPRRPEAFKVTQLFFVWSYLIVYWEGLMLAIHLRIIMVSVYLAMLAS